MEPVGCAERPRMIVGGRQLERDDGAATCAAGQDCGDPDVPPRRGTRYGDERTFLAVDTRDEIQTANERRAIGPKRHRYIYALRLDADACGLVGGQIEREEGGFAAGEQTPDDGIR